MLKKISAKDVRLGMYIEELCGSWMEHPFWKTSFLLDDQKDLVALKTCGLHDVWINTDKGKDIQPDAVVLANNRQEKCVETELTGIAIEGDASLKKASMSQEIHRARAILAHGQQAVTSMFGEVRMGNAISLNGVEALVEEISGSISRNPEAFLNLARIKNADNYTYLHSVAVSGLMIALGKQLGMSGQDLKDAGVAGLMHDIGKAGIPDAVLNKPGKLSDEEFRIIKQHPRKGWEYLRESDDVNPVALDVVLHHHERVDGTGYPDQLSEKLLSVFAKMSAVCDVYDALTSDRCYKKGWAPAEALRKMAEWKEGHFDERIFHAFVKTVGIYPSGTLVKLQSGRLGVVIEQSQKSLLEPVLKVFYSTKSNAFIQPETLDLSKSTEKISNIEITKNWNFDLNQVMDMGA